MKKIVSLILAALLLFAFTAVAEQETEHETQQEPQQETQQETQQAEPQTYSWDQFSQMAELMGAEGNWATYDQFNLKMWIPAEFVQTPDDEMPENLKSQGYIDLFGSNDYELAIGVQHSFYDEEVDTVADLADIIDASQYDAPTLTKINNYDVLLLTENQGENLDVCIGGGKGEFLIFHYFHMNADQWCMDRAAISMASIQDSTSEQ